MSLLIIIPAFLVTIGVLVTVHEFGHFWVARKLGVKVLRFSIGFGKPLWKHVSNDADRIEYVVAALPLGGYVKMLDERECEDGCQIPQQDLPRAFNRQALWKRAAIVVAGPLANFLLAIAVYAAVGMLGQEVRHAYIDPAAGKPAAIAGFQPGDRVVSIAGKPIEAMGEMPIRLIDGYFASAEHQVVVGVNTRDGANAERVLDLRGSALLEEDNDVMEKLGFNPWMPPFDLLVAEVIADSPAARAGVQAGDKILLAGGQAFPNPGPFSEFIANHADQPVNLRISRADGDHDLQVVPRMDTERNRVMVGIAFKPPPDSVKEQLYFERSYGLFDALVKGVEQTADTSIMTLKLMGRMLTGEVALKNISGPVTIAQFAGVTASYGLTYYLGFLAVVSVSLGVLNLLPVPMLDGGHLLYYLIELVKGSPVSEQVEAAGFRIGMAIIAGLMMLALYNDFMRLIN
ncbi:MAG: RIP metalloprotease RseP [Gammaproteobacteria bacterium]|nr:RIP metalloprotease RseP [Gammaproteobacteria bacterium]MBU1723597.1 RIP metalloprotease RseP [Gammaproteobacteria bacterium]MBU2004252.1 RIP metalloprotease RseP [Gammaproteobacteria bacterium]